MKTKKCSKCGKTKPGSEFHKDKKSKSGLTSWCKECKKKHSIHIKPDPKKARESTRRYREAHPERVREANRRYREAHPEKTRESVRRFRKANPEYLTRRSAAVNEIVADYIKELGPDIP